MVGLNLGIFFLASSTAVPNPTAPISNPNGANIPVSSKNPPTDSSRVTAASSPPAVIAASSPTVVSTVFSPAFSAVFAANLSANA